MLLNLTLHKSPTTAYLPIDLGFLLHKHPEHLQAFELNFGKAYVFYPEVNSEKCTVSLLLEMDPIHLVRTFKKVSGQPSLLEHYVNDRPYSSNSFLSVALASVFGSALNGKSKERPALAETELPFEVDLPVLPSRGGKSVLLRLFEPLGYNLELQGHVLDEQFEEWGHSSYYSLRLKKVTKLRELLSHLYVLIPVLDNNKHYWVSEAEIEKLQRHGEHWVAQHPMKSLIIRRYFKGQMGLSKKALNALIVDEDPVESPVEEASEEQQMEKTISLNESRMKTVLDTIRSVSPTSVIDFGCGEGKLLKALLKIHRLQKITGVDVSPKALELAEKRLKLERLPEKMQQKVQLIQGALQYQDTRFSGHDVATCIEVIEHLEEDRLEAMEQVLFQYANPQTVIITTPNVEYNQKFENLKKGKFRHADHRFEWDRASFQNWGPSLAQTYGWHVTFSGIGNEDPNWGCPTQMAVFQKP